MTGAEVIALAGVIASPITVVAVGFFNAQREERQASREDARLAITRNDERLKELRQTLDDAGLVLDRLKDAATGSLPHMAATDSPKTFFRSEITNARSKQHRS